MQGYGDQKTIAGIRANGINGVLTLSQSEKSGLLPNLSGEETPLELHAGPGVRLHGYGDMQRLEILPVVVIEEESLGPARLDWEFERSQGFCQVCAIDYSEETEDAWVYIRALTYNFTGGSYVDTETASGATTPYGANDTPPGNCADIVPTSTYDREVDYGEPTGTSLAETLISFASAAASAVGAMDVWSSPTGSQEWQENTWKNVSTGVTPFTTTLGASGEISLSYTPGRAEAGSLRFRLINRGSVSLKVNCGFYGSGISGGASDIESVIELAPGTTSAWQTPPTPDNDPDKYLTAKIQRVRIGRYRTVS
jgi:hypothetical protein